VWLLDDGRPVPAGRSFAPVEDVSGEGVPTSMDRRRRLLPSINMPFRESS
jgi:hypothetical protein